MNQFKQLFPSFTDSTDDVYHCIHDPIFRYLGTGLSADNLMPRINDARIDIFQKELNNIEVTLQNAAFVCVYVNGWPSIYVVATKDIAPDTPIRANYGEVYGTAIVEKTIVDTERANREKQAMQIIVQNNQNILQHSQVYVLE